ncbi:hypothetical protein E4T56_gene7401, partial [Termitomyces sp. T112]
MSLTRNSNSVDLPRTLYGHRDIAVSPLLSSSRLIRSKPVVGNSFVFSCTAMNSRPPKQSMSELKLRRLMEHNQRLREDLALNRIRVSVASADLIRYCKSTKDSLLPS